MGVHDFFLKTQDIFFSKNQDTIQNSEKQSGHQKIPFIKFREKSGHHTKTLQKSGQLLKNQDCPPQKQTDGHPTNDPQVFLVYRFWSICADSNFKQRFD